MSHDMTKEERKNTKSLDEEAKQKTKEFAQKSVGNSKNWVFRVRGPPWDQKIMKVKPYPQL